MNLGRFGTIKVNPVVQRLPTVSYRTRKPGKTYLDLNEPMFEEHERRTIDALLVSKGAEVLERTLHQYPLDSVLDLALRERLSDALSCSPDNLLITRGSDAGLKVAFEAFAFSGTTVGVLDPTYDSVYDMLTRSTPSAAGKRVRIPCESALDFPEALSEGPNYDVVYLCNPNNPLGYVIQRADILREIDARPDTLFIVDEAYIAYACGLGSEGVAVSVASDVMSRRNLIVMRSFSKAYGIPGARLGVIAASTEIVCVLRKLVCPTEVPDTSKAIGLVCLHPELPELRAAYHGYFDRIHALRASFVRELESIKNKGFVGVVGVVGGSSPSGAGLFVAIELADESVSRRLVAYLDDEWDIVVKRSSYEDRASQKRHLVRCQIGTTEATQKLEKGIGAFFVYFANPNSTLPPVKT